MRRIAWCLLALALGPALAFPQALKLDSLDQLAAQASNSVKVTLEGSLLRLATRFLSSDDPEEARGRLLHHLERPGTGRLAVAAICLAGYDRLPGS